MNSTDLNINERAQHLLTAVVERYIRDGQPVGSKTLAEETTLGLSSATIRNVLSELEEHGYLHSPHTSAGRIPTVQGYRFFVNGILSTQQLTQPDLRLVEEQLNGDQNPAALVAKASNLLTDLTQFVGLVMLPRGEQVVLRHVEFLPLSDNRVLVILVLNEQEVQNRVINTDRAYNVSELQQAANYLNMTYAGQEISKVKQALFAAMQEDRASITQLMQAAADVAGKAFQQTKEPNDYVMAGQNRIFDLAEITNLSRLRQLFEVFNQKQGILHLLDQCLSTNGVQIFIGEESGYDIFDECSVITAPYTVKGQVVGVLGVIGPTRMPYERVIPIVDVTAKVLSVALNLGK